MIDKKKRGDALIKGERSLSVEQRRPVRSRSFASPGGPDLDLHRVLQEIADLMGADGALLTMHPEDLPPTLVYAERRLREAGIEGMCFELCCDVEQRLEDGIGIWQPAEDGSALFLMPIQRTPGHSQMVISIFFKAGSEMHRATAERLYRERRPLAIGFFRLWQQNRLLQQRTNALETVLDRTSIGVILLSQSGQIVLANETAEEILAEADGLSRTGHTLRAAHLADGVHLHAALSHATAGAGEGSTSATLRAPMLAFRRRHGQPLIASILPAADVPIEANDVAAIMYVVDPDIDTDAALSPICRLYGLSQVETSLVCRLARGDTLAAAARAIHVKEQTARGYLKAIFIKTGTARQLDLIVMMLSSFIRMKRGIKHEEILFSRTPATG